MHILIFPQKNFYLLQVPVQTTTERLARITEYSDILRAQGWAQRMKVWTFSSGDRFISTDEIKALLWNLCRAHDMSFLWMYSISTVGPKRTLADIIDSPSFADNLICTVFSLVDKSLNMRICIHRYLHLMLLQIFCSLLSSFPDLHQLVSLFFSLPWSENLSFHHFSVHTKCIIECVNWSFPYLENHLSSLLFLRAYFWVICNQTADFNVNKTQLLTFLLSWMQETHRKFSYEAIVETWERGISAADVDDIDVWMWFVPAKVYMLEAWTPE